MTESLTERLKSSAVVREQANRFERLIAHVIATVAPRHVMRNKRFFDIWERHGYHVTPVHFYEPVPDSRVLAKMDLDRPSELVGLDLDLGAQLGLLGDCLRWREEYKTLQREKGLNPDDFYLENRFFGAVDAEILYCLIRSRRPRRIFEIGSGFSTLLAGHAVYRNEREGSPCELVAFEPYPSEALRRGAPGVSRVVERRLQDVPLETFGELSDGDVLFIDSSHVVAPGSDVCLELLEIVPRVKRGVLVHLHDIFFPHEYPRRWLLDNHYFWTEQYLLHAFLSFNSAFRVLWAEPLWRVNSQKSWLRRSPPSRPGEQCPAASGWLGPVTRI